VLRDIRPLSFFLLIDKLINLARLENTLDAAPLSATRPDRGPVSFKYHQRDTRLTD